MDDLDDLCKEDEFHTELEDARMDYEDEEGANCNRAVSDCSVVDAEDGYGSLFLECPAWKQPRVAQYLVKSIYVTLDDNT